MHTSGQEQRGAGALEVVEANVALPDEHFGSDAGRHRSFFTIGPRLRD